MLVFKFAKIDSAKFISHLDVLKAVTRTILRAELEVKYSEGFNPHMLLNLSNPIPLGIESEAEYCFVNCDYKVKEFKKLYAQYQLPALPILDCFAVDKNPNIAGLSHSAEYEISADGLKIADVESYLGSKQVFIEYFDKNGQVVKDIKPLLYGYEQKSENTIKVCLAFGNINLRADRLSYNLCNKFDYDTSSLHIKKTATSVLQNEKITEVDKYLSSL